MTVHRINGWFQPFTRAESGSIAVKMALLTPVLVLVVGGGLDYSILTNQKSRLQSAIDAGALAAAKELGLADAKRENVQAIVEAVVQSYLSDNHDQTYGGGKVSLTATVRGSPLEVAVMATQDVDLPFDGAFGAGSAALTTSTVARIAGKPNICVLGLDPDEAGTIQLMNDAKVTGQNCAVFSNSSHTNGLTAKNSSRLTADLICSRGGKDADAGVFSPDPILDCPSFEDPLALRPEPMPSACLETNLTIKNESRSLLPGTYCGGITISQGSVVTFEPGVFIIQDGPLDVGGGSSVTGAGVGFYFTGKKATFGFAKQSTIELSAPESGPMAGLLMFESRSQPKTGKHNIMSDDARTLVGTIYLPASELRVDASAPIADKSAYTAIVARAMRLYGGPHLVLNTNYDQTSVPVPEGIAGAGQPVALVE